MVLKNVFAEKFGVKKLYLLKIKLILLAKKRYYNIDFKKIANFSENV
jgi:hypothetical protein